MDEEAGGVTGLKLRPVTEADYALAEQFKRATVVEATGNMGLFDVWFPTDRPYVSVLERLLGYDPASCAQVLVDGVVAGQVDVNVGTGGHLSNIYVLPEFRGLGLGARLEQYAVDLCRSKGVRVMTLRTNPENHVVRFYERLGWVRGEAAEYGLVWMEKDLGV